MRRKQSTGHEPRSNTQPWRVLTALLVVVIMGAVVAGPVDAKWGRGPTSPRTTVLAPSDGDIIDSGGILAIGRASHRVGVAGVLVVVKNLDSETYWNGSSWQAEFIRVEGNLDEVGQRKAVWSLRVPPEVLDNGNYRVRGFAYSVEGNGDSNGGDLVEFSYQSESSPPPSTTTTTEPTTTSTSEPPMTVTTIEPTTTSSEPPSTVTTIAPTTTSSTTTTQPPSKCGDQAKLVPCRGMLLGSTGDFADADGNWQSPQQDFRRQEQRLGHDFDVFHEYNQWRDIVDRSWPSAETQALADEGRIIFANWKSPTSNPSDWGQIASGQFDADIKKAAQQITDFADPVFLTFFHEPEDDIKRAAGDDVAKQNALVDDYAAAFARIVRVFEQAGADNAIWVWNIQGWLGHKELYDAGLYPGDDVVDWVAYNSYNWHGCDNHGNSPQWKEFEPIYQRFYDWVESDGPGRPGADKPLMLGEWGTEENDGATNSNQTKAEWFDDARQHFADQTFPRIKAAIYFDTEGTRPDGSIQFCRWALDSSPEATQSFSNLMAEPALRPVWN